MRMEKVNIDISFPQSTHICSAPHRRLNTMGYDTTQCEVCKRRYISFAEEDYRFIILAAIGREIKLSFGAEVRIILYLTEDRWYCCAWMYIGYDTQSRGFAEGCI